MLGELLLCSLWQIIVNLNGVLINHVFTISAYLPFLGKFVIILTFNLY